MTHPSSNMWMRALWVLVIFSCTALFFVGLGSYGLLDNNEGLYATIARDMFMSGNFIIPSVNGVPYIEKPPLLYWLMSGCFHLFGTTEFAARLTPALAGLLTTSLCAAFMARLRGEKCALITATILGSSLGFVIFSRNIFFDGLFTFFLTGALLSLYLGWKTKARAPKLALYAFVAGAVMTKGLVALVLIGLVWCVFWGLHARHHDTSFFMPLDPWGIVLFVALASPWHILASLKLETFAHFYFINEHVLRFLGKRVPKDYYSGPITYYTWRVLLYMLPWTFFLPRFFFQKHKPRDSLCVFMAVSFCTIFAFFSLSQAKANYYLMAAIPSLAMMLAIKLSSQNTFRLSALIGLLLSVFLPLMLLADHMNERVLLSEFSRYLVHFSSATYGGWAALGLALFGILFLGRKKAPTGPVYVNLSMAMLLTVCAQMMPVAEDEVSGKSTGRYLADQREQVFFYQDYERISGVAFYLKGPVHMIDSQSSDLLFGQTVRPDLFLSSEGAQTQKGFVVVWKKRASAFTQVFPGARLEKTFGPHLIYRLGA
ncbi:MAG: glycosyltransferase family 39 protein [Proteobacteria bacterium]|nr:glycosyltransferase family 39 protein [Pseudomonadota bacterium]